MSDRPTICVKCVHCVKPQSAWDDYSCQVSPLEPKLNVVTGVMEGEGVYSFCRDVNDGNCLKYELKEDV